MDPETESAISPEIEQLQLDHGNLQVIAQSLETAKVALSLKAVTHPEQTERIALFDRLIAGTGMPLLNPNAPAWNLAPKDPATNGDN